MASATLIFILLQNNGAAAIAKLNANPTFQTLFVAKLKIRSRLTLITYFQTKIYTK